MMQQCFLFLKSSKKTILNFFLDSLIVTDDISNGTPKNIELIE